MPGVSDDDVFYLAWTSSMVPDLSFVVCCLSRISAFRPIGFGAEIHGFVLPSS